MILEKPVSLELAKLLKERGYNNDECLYYYSEDCDDDFIPEMKDNRFKKRDDEILLGEFDYLSPTISQVVDWLYEEHYIWIVVVPFFSNFYCYISDFKNNKTHNGSKTNNSPEKVYELGIEYALKYLLR